MCMAPDFLIVDEGKVKMAPPGYILGQHCHCWSDREKFIEKKTGVVLKDQKIRMEPLSHLFLVDYAFQSCSLSGSDECSHSIIQETELLTIWAVRAYVINKK